MGVAAACAISMSTRQYKPLLGENKNGLPWFNTKIG